VPTIRNRTSQLLHLHRVGREIEPEQSIDVSDDEAQMLAGHPLLTGVPPYPQPEPPVITAVAAKPSKPITTQEDGDSQ
jgi:hypothetical protein